MLSFDEVEFHGPWRIRRSTSNIFMDQIIDTSAIGSKLSFRLRYRVYIGLDCSSLSAAFRWRIDGGEWSEVASPLADMGPVKREAGFIWHSWLMIWKAESMMLK